MMTDPERLCPDCGVQPGYRHGRRCNTLCRISAMPMVSCPTDTGQPPHNFCSPSLWCPSTSDGLIAISLVDDDRLLTTPCGQCQKLPLPGTIVLIPPGEEYLFHFSCLVGLVETLEGIVDPHRSQDSETQQAFQANKADLIAYLQRTTHDR